MDPRTESIKQEVEETLENMAEKMEQIESRVYGAARETVQNVKEKLDIRHLTAEHPWTMLGASVAVGFLAGNIRRSESRRRHRLGEVAELEGGRRFSYEHSDDPYEHSASDEDFGMTEMVHVSGYERGEGGYGEESSGYRRGVSGYGREERQRPSREIVRRSISRVSSRVKESAPSLIASLKEHFGDEIEAVKRAALVTVGNSLRQLVQTKLPQFAQEFDRARQDSGRNGEQGGWQSQQRTQGWSQGQHQQGESRYGGESRSTSGSQYGSEGRYGSGNQYGGEYQGQSERYGSQGYQGQGRSGSQAQGGYGSQSQQGQGRYGSQGQGEGRYGSQGQGQQGQGRYGSQGQGEGRHGGQQVRGYNPESSSIGSSVDEHGNRDNEGGYGNTGYPGRKGHN